MFVWVSLKVEITTMYKKCCDFFNIPAKTHTQISFKKDSVVDNCEEILIIICYIKPALKNNYFYCNWSVNGNPEDIFLFWLFGILVLVFCLFVGNN